MAGTRQRRRAPIAVESVGKPVAVDALAALLVSRLRPAPTLRVVSAPADEQQSRTLSPVQQGPLRRLD